MSATKTIKATDLYNPKVATLDDDNHDYFETKQGLKLNIESYTKARDTAKEMQDKIVEAIEHMFISDDSIEESFENGYLVQWDSAISKVMKGEGTYYVFKSHMELPYLKQAVLDGLDFIEEKRDQSSITKDELKWIQEKDWDSFEENNSHNPAMRLGTLLEEVDLLFGDHEEFDTYLQVLEEITGINLEELDGYDL